VVQVSGCTAVVTGAGSGVGLALARLLVAGGARVIMADRNATAVGAAAADLGVTGVVADVSRPEDNEALAELAGAARIVCLNAGVVSSHAGPVWLTPPDEWVRVLEINLGGVVNGLRAFVLAWWPMGSRIRSSSRPRWPVWLRGRVVERTPRRSTPS
jgi:1-deoxy-11beta-hydroxypentalenate dehydrogenase